MNKNIRSFLKFAALPAFLLTVLSGLFLTSCGGGDEDKSSGTETTGPVAGIDLTPDNFAVSATSVVKGTEVKLSLKVKNQGTEASGAVTVTFYKSTDGTITPSDDTVLGRDATILSLDGETLSAELSTMATENAAGPVFYGACVETTDDTDTSNDCTAGTKVTFTETAGVDLIPYGFAVSATSVVKDDNVTLSSKVKNQGTAASTAAILTFYKSTDETIDSSDTEVGNGFALTGLGMGALSAESSTMATESAAGSVYYGACVVTTDDTDASNDCTAGTEVIFTDSASADLALDRFAVAPSTIAPSGEVVLSVRVKNSGSAASAAETLTYYLASSMTADGTAITGKDATVDVLTMGATQSYTAMVQAGTASTYYYYACVTSTGTGSTADANSSNDCSSRAELTVMTSGTQTPNLTLGDTLTVKGSSTATVAKGKSAAFAVTVTNSGTAISGAETLKYYSSTTNSNDPQSLTDIESVNIAALDASRTISDSRGLIVEGTVGTTYYYFACVSNTGSTPNCSNTVSVIVGAPAPDLGVGTLTVTDSDVSVNDNIEFSVTVTNEGTVSSAEEDLIYYRSTTGGNLDSPVTSSVTSEALSPEQVVDVDVLIAGGTAPGGETFPATTPKGTWYYYACITSTGTGVAVDSNSANDCSNKVRVNVSVVGSATLDLKVFDLALNTPSSGDVKSGSDIKLGFKVQNIGTTGGSGALTFDYYRSTDSTAINPANDSSKKISVPDTATVAADVANLTVSAGERSVISGTITVETVTSNATYYYTVCVSATLNEAATAKANNCDQLAVPVIAPVVVQSLDLIPTGLVLRNSINSGNAVIADGGTLLAGDSIQISVKVRNNSSNAVLASGEVITVKYYMSADTSFADDEVVGTTSFSSGLAVGSEKDVLKSDFLTQRDKGTLYYGVCISGGGEDSANTGNNCVSQAVVVNATSGVDIKLHDLVVYKVDSSGVETVVTYGEGSVSNGDNIKMRVVIKNLGDAASAALTLRYYGSDNDVLNTSDVPQQSAKGISSVAANGDSGSSLTDTMTGTKTQSGLVSGEYYYGACISKSSDGSDEHCIYDRIAVQ